MNDRTLRDSVNEALRTSELEPEWGGRLAGFADEFPDECWQCGTDLRKLNAEEAKGIVVRNGARFCSTSCSDEEEKGHLI